MYMACNLIGFVFDFFFWSAQSRSQGNIMIMMRRCVMRMLTHEKQS
jgi:hypothetical protein